MAAIRSFEAGRARSARFQGWFSQEIPLGASKWAKCRQFPPVRGADPAGFQPWGLCGQPGGTAIPPAKL